MILTKPPIGYFCRAEFQKRYGLQDTRAKVILKRQFDDGKLHKIIVKVGGILIPYYKAVKLKKEMTDASLLRSSV